MLSWHWAGPWLRPRFVGLLGEVKEAEIGGVRTLGKGPVRRVLYPGPPTQLEIPRRTQCVFAVSPQTCALSAISSLGQDGRRLLAHRCRQWPDSES